MKVERTLKRIGRTFSKINPRTAISLGCFALSRYIDLEDKDNIATLRTLNFVSVMMTLSLLAFMVQKIRADPDGQRMITVKESDIVPPSPFAEDAEDPVLKVTVEQYDFTKIRARFTELATQVAVVTGIHAYSGYVFPLMIQACTSGLTTIESELFKIHVLGRDPKVYRDLKRPWSTNTNSMLSMFQKSYKQANAMVETLEGKPAAEKPTKERKGKKGKKQR